MNTDLATPQNDERRVVRDLPAGFRSQNDLLALTLFGLDVLLFLALIAAAALRPWIAAQIFAGMLAGVVTLRLASIAHDAGHNSYTSHRSWNRIICRVAFLPALEPFTTWEVAHNVIHHSWTSIKDKDYVWIPLSKQEYDSCSAPRRLVERAYRSLFGQGLYLVELWWRRVVIPSANWSTVPRAVQRVDILSVAGFACVWCAALILTAIYFQRSIVRTVIAGQAVPFLSWCQAFGFTLYVQHTHPKTGFYLDKAGWEYYAAQVSNSTHLDFPPRIAWLHRGIFDHTAHHLNVRIPFYRLGKAQQLLDEVLSGGNVVQRWSFAAFAQCVRRCKLYDYEQHCWTDFDGNPTAYVHR